MSMKEVPGVIGSVSMGSLLSVGLTLMQCKVHVHVTIEMLVRD